MFYMRVMMFVRNIRVYHCFVAIEFIRAFTQILKFSYFYSKKQ